MLVMVSATVAGFLWSLGFQEHRLARNLHRPTLLSSLKDVQRALMRSPEPTEATMSSLLCQHSDAPVSCVLLTMSARLLSAERGEAFISGGAAGISELGSEAGSVGKDFPKLL